MQIIDTHNHIYLPEFDADRDEVIKRAADAGVTLILMPNIDSSSVEPMMTVAERYPGICLPMMALHPVSVRENYREELALMEIHLKKHNYRGIGETGIDLYRDKSFLKEQIISFRRHLELAEEYSLPLVIHARESLEIIIEEITAFGSGRVTGIFHAFPGNGEDARRVTDMGFTIGIGGVVTFRNGRQGEAALAAGPDNIVVETDAPYLTPVPFRGKRNEPSYLKYIIDKLAEIFKLSAEEVAERTTENAKTLFKLK